MAEIKVWLKLLTVWTAVKISNQIKNKQIKFSKGNVGDVIFVSTHLK